MVGQAPLYCLRQLQWDYDQRRHVERSAAESKHLAGNVSRSTFAARFLIAYAIPIKHGNSNNSALSFCYFFFLLNYVKLLLLISPGAGSGPRIPALRGPSGDRPPRTYSGG